MKLLLIDASTRENTATGQALDRLASALTARGIETERFWPVSDPRAACCGCGACRGAGVCVNDLRPVHFVKAASGCDGFVFAAPTNLLGNRLRVDMKNFLAAVASRAARKEPNPLAGKCAAGLVAARFGSGAAALAQMYTALEGAGLRPAGEGISLPEASDGLLERLAEALAAALR